MMKYALIICILLTISCNELKSTVKVTPGSESKRFESLTVTNMEVRSNKIVFTGNNLDTVSKVDPQDSKLNNYSFSIDTKSTKELILNVLHPSGTVLNIAASSLYSFLFRGASAQTVVNVTTDAGIPSGAIMAFNGACPTGWSAADGSGSNPDARGRTLVGAGTGPGLSARTLGDVGGTETHTLSVLEMPAHQHNVNIAIPVDSTVGTDPSPVANILSINGDSHYSSNPANNTMLDFDEASDNTGGNQSHNIMQPYLVVQYCIKD